MKKEEEERKKNKRKLKKILSWEERKILSEIIFRNAICHRKKIIETELMVQNPICFFFFLFLFPCLKKTRKKIM